MSFVRHTNKNFLVTTCVIAMFGLAGCESDNTFTKQLSDRDGYIETIPKNEVTETPFSYAVKLSEGQVRLDAGQNADLSNFLSGIGRDRGDHYEIRTAYTTSDQSQMGRNNKIARDLRKSFVSQGVFADRIQLVHVPGYENTLELIVRRYTIISPACGVIDVDLGNKWTNEPAQTRKFGCSNEHNLAQMLADPRDLVGGRPFDPASGEREALGVRMHGEGTIPKLEESTTSTTGKQ